MVKLDRSDGPARSRLSKERVRDAALLIADQGGLSGLTIRSLAEELGAKPMSVYYYVASKDELLDLLVDVVFEEIELPDPEGDWHVEMRRRACSARDRLKEHSWANRSAGVAHHTWARDPSSSRRGSGVPAACRVLPRADRPRLCTHRQLRLRVRPPRGGTPL
jgi:AcrR family transcriptional regulator